MKEHYIELMKITFSAYTDGKIADAGRIAANGNGRYRVFVATAQSKLNVKIEIIKN